MVAGWTPAPHHIERTESLLECRAARSEVRGAIDWITRETWECDAGEFRGRFIAYESNIDGNGQVFLFDVKTRKRKALGAKSGLSSLGSEVFSPDGKEVMLVFILGTSASRCDLLS